MASNPSEIFKRARQIKRGNLDVSMIMNEISLLVTRIRREPCSSITIAYATKNSPDLLPPAPPVRGPPPEISQDLVEMAVKKPNSGKSSRASDITAETIKGQQPQASF